MSLEDSSEFESFKNSERLKKVTQLSLTRGRMNFITLVSDPVRFKTLVNVTTIIETTNTPQIHPTKMIALPAIVLG